MRIEIMTLAEIAACVLVVAGGTLLGGVGGCLLSIGAVLFYEVRG